MGTLSLGIIGIYSLSPVLLKAIFPAVSRLSTLLGIDPSVIPACIFPVDMGGYQLSKSLMANAAIGRFSAVVIASTLGTVVGFTLPVACGFIRKEDEECFANGVLIGTAALPFGCFAAGIACGLPPDILLRNLTPMILLSVLLGFGLAVFSDAMLRGFKVFGKFVTGLSILGLLLQGIDVITGVRLLPGMVPFGETVALVGRITLILAGSYALIETLNRVFRKSLQKAGNLLGIDAVSVASMIGNLASNLVVFGNLGRMNRTGKILCTSLGVSGAFILGGQLAYVASVDIAMMGPFFVCKLFSGLLSILIVLGATKHANNCYKNRKKIGCRENG
jgi:ethanolamine transporter